MPNFMSVRKAFACTVAALVLLSHPKSASASGFLIGPQSASAAGQANAFTAQADDASAIHYNPAGMTQLRGLQLSGGTNLAGGHISYQDALGNTTRGDLGGSIAVP